MSRVVSFLASLTLGVLLTVVVMAYVSEVVIGDAAAAALVGAMIVCAVVIIGADVVETERLARECSRCFGTGVDGDGLLCRRCGGVAP